MAKNQTPHRSLQEWFELVTECRQSGLSDTEWCILNGISNAGPDPFTGMLQMLRGRIGKCY